MFLKTRMFSLQWVLMILEGKAGPTTWIGIHFVNFRDVIEIEKYLYIPNGAPNIVYHCITLSYCLEISISTPVSRNLLRLLYQRTNCPPPSRLSHSMLDTAQIDNCERHPKPRSLEQRTWDALEHATWMR